MTANDGGAGEGVGFREGSHDFEGERRGISRISQVNFIMTHTEPKSSDTSQR